MNELKFDSLKNFFDEIDGNYENLYKEEKGVNGKVTNKWEYRWELKRTVEKLIEGFDIKINNINIDIMGKDRPTQSKDKIGLFIMPKKHSISNGVYLVIKKNYDNQDVGFRFAYSDTSKPMDHIREMMDSFDTKYNAISNISDNNLDNIAKEKINKFIELSKKHNFKSMKIKGGGKWDLGYQSPYKPSPLKAKENGEEKNYVINEINYPSNFILFGPPGTGKTYKTVDIATGIIGGIKDRIDSVEKIINVDKIEDFDEKGFHEENTKTFNIGLNDGVIHFVTFHQNYSYEEFVGGLRPDENNEDKLRFQWKPGIFIKACAKALELAIKEKPNETEKKDLEKWFLKQCTEKKYTDFQDFQRYDFISEKVVLIIDEINRANISRVFGELITLIESDKRLGAKHQLILTLPNGDKKFAVPKNLIIMGTMNTADKSLALLDVALRRRFEFKRLFPKEILVKDDYQNLFNIINNNILKKKGPDFQIGHSYFMEGDIKTIINDKILPLLNEYFMGDNKKIKEVFQDSRNDTKQIKNEYGIEEESGVLKYIAE